MSELFYAIVMACSFVIKDEKESCKAYAPECFYIESYRTSDIKEIKEACTESIEKIYTMK